MIGANLGGGIFSDLEDSGSIPKKINKNQLKIADRIHKNHTIHKIKNKNKKNHKIYKKKNADIHKIHKNRKMHKNPKLSNVK